MKIVLVKRNENSGKSTLLINFIKLLIDNGFELIIKNIVGGKEYDVSVLLRKGDFTVLVHCAADDDARIDELERFLKYTKNVDFVVTACRSKGKYCKRVQNLLQDFEKPIDLFEKPIDMKKHASDTIRAIGEMNLELKEKVQALLLEKTKEYKALQDEAQKQAIEELDMIEEKYANNERVKNMLLNATETKLAGIMNNCTRFIDEAANKTKGIIKEFNELPGKLMDEKDITGILGKDICSGLSRLYQIIIVESMRKSSPRLLESFKSFLEDNQRSFLSSIERYKAELLKS